MEEATMRSRPPLDMTMEILYLRRAPEETKESFNNYCPTKGFVEGKSLS